jgi:hypothetical protein
MDLGTSMVLSPHEDGDDLSRYLVSFATKGYCSNKFYQACGFGEGSVQIPLTRQDLMQEDHYQMLQTLKELVKAREDNVTEYTSFML